MEKQVGFTGKATDVIFCSEQTQPSQLVLQERPIYEAKSCRIIPFKGDASLMPDEIIGLLEDLLTENKKEVKAKIPKVPEEVRLHQVRTLHHNVLTAIENNRGPLTNRGIARDVGCHPQTVARITQWLNNSTLPVPEYIYNNSHSQETLEALDSSIRDPVSAMFSVTDFKRRNSGCSKKFIQKRLKTVHGLRYLKLKRERKDPNKDKYNKTRMDLSLLRTVVWRSALAFAKNSETILFLDECEFAFYQTTDYSWAKSDERPVYNRRTTGEEALHVVAICSQERMVAFQIFEGHPSKYDIYYFLKTFLDKWGEAAEGVRTRAKSLVILLDNAGWHVANLITKSCMSPFLQHSVPYAFELNLIELIFSKAKAEWRKRPVTESLKEEVDFLVEVFKRRVGEKGFEGYKRQYLRQVKDVVEKRLVES